MADFAAEESADTTYASVLTPPGRGAVATVAVDGPAALAAVAGCFEPLSGRSLQSYAPDSIVVGLFRGENGSAEELVVGLIRSDRIEVHCHGGRAAVQAVVRALTSAGCTERTWQEHVGVEHTSIIEAEAWTALASATTERTAGILLDQARGALRREIDETILLLQSGKPGEAQAKLQALLDRSRIGLHLTQPWRIVIAGRPNVGKSSLINALAGYQRAIVFDQPGTTRDVLTTRTAIDGWPIELSDTAGLRSSADQIEAAGIAKAHDAFAAADLVLAVFEAGRAWTAADDEFLQRLAKTSCLVVYNKLDLAPIPSDLRPWGIALSARTRENLDQLLAAISERLVPSPPTSSLAIPFTKPQVDALRAASQALAAGDGSRAIQILSETLATPSADRSLP